MDLFLMTFYVTYKNIKKMLRGFISVSEPINIASNTKKRKKKQVKYNLSFLFVFFNFCLFKFSSYQFKRSYFKKPLQTFSKSVTSLPQPKYSQGPSLFIPLFLVFSFFSYAALALLSSFFILVSLVFLKKSFFFKMVCSWLCVFYFIYLLISGFVFFLKKYTFSKFTGAIQRF
jgi:hypothetical protein